MQQSRTASGLAAVHAAVPICGRKEAEFGRHGPGRSTLRDTCRPGPGRLVKTYREALKPFEQKRLLTYRRCVATLAARPRKAPARVSAPHHSGRECSAKRGSRRIGDCKNRSGSLPARHATPFPQCAPIAIFASAFATAVAVPRGYINLEADSKALAGSQCWSTQWTAGRRKEI